jgi:hypothetical protein
MAAQSRVNLLRRERGDLFLQLAIEGNAAALVFERDEPGSQDRILGPLHSARCSQPVLRRRPLPE